MRRIPHESLPVFDKPAHVANERVDGRICALLNAVATCVTDSKAVTTQATASTIDPGDTCKLLKRHIPEPMAMPWTVVAYSKVDVHVPGENVQATAHGLVDSSHSVTFPVPFLKMSLKVMQRLETKITSRS